MIDPLSHLYATGLDCLLPVLALMSGALLLGTLIGWTGNPVGKADLARMGAELERERRALADVRTRLDKAGTLLNQRQKAREEELATAQGTSEHVLAALNAEVASLKMALAAAKRPAPMAHEGTFRHATRLAEVEREAARVPKLMKELEDLRARVALTAKQAGAPKATRPSQPLPEQVYRLMSTSFGRRIEPDDLELVEGIGPKIAEHLSKHGLKTWADVAGAKPTQLRRVLDAAGDRFQLHDPAHWPEQCKLMVENRWEELRKYQRKLSNAR